MNDINEKRFREIVIELIDENPFAIRAVLKILDIVVTAGIPTLAVTCESHPRLLVSLEFLKKYCRDDQQVKAVICHEFLHVLLRHTETRGAFSAAKHMAFDAVINAIIHRQYGAAYSSMMSNYYAEAQDLTKLLRPMNAQERASYARQQSDQRFGLPQWVHTWDALYKGRLVVDDIEALIVDMKNIGGADGLEDDAGSGLFKLKTGLPEGLDNLLGDHENIGKPLPEGLRDALEEALRQMDGSGIWHSPKSRGVGANPYETLLTAHNDPMRNWERKTLEILKRHLSPDRHSRARRLEEAAAHIPVLSPKDRRAFMRALWAPFLPDAEWNTQQPKREGTAQVYLDVSGSMCAEMPTLIALLGRLLCYIRRPFWAFSDGVAPAVIEQGQLKARSTGGTNMTCVLEHIAKTRPAAAVIVSDGHIETLDPRLVARIAGTRLHVLVTRGGSTEELRRAGLSYTRLRRISA
ncbi:MAG: hypothetical protein WCK75_05190 [Elusimicrobiota bacterium]